MSTAEAIMEKVSFLPPEQQNAVLEYVDSLIKKAGCKPSEPYSALREIANLKLDGPSDASTRFHEHLYGENARDNR